MSVKLQNLLDLDIYTAKAEPQFQLQSLVWFGFWVVELLLITRLLLKFFTSYPDSFLTGITYSITEYLLMPLTIVFDVSSTPDSGFEWITLFTILLYWLLTIGTLALLKTSKDKSSIEIARAYSKRKYGH